MIKAVFYEILYIIKQDAQNKTIHKMRITQGKIHLERSMRFLTQHYREYHDIRYYASIMDLSPKYLSLLIKRSSGMLATKWIDDYVILEANMTIQKVAYAFHLPNQSFFGKNFKKHTGVSPKAYRE